MPKLKYNWLNSGSNDLPVPADGGIFIFAHSKLIFFQVLGYSLYFAGLLMFTSMSILCFDLFFTFVYTKTPLKDQVSPKTGSSWFVLL